MNTFIALVLGSILSTAGIDLDDPLKTMPSKDADRIRQHLPGVVIGPGEAPQIEDADDWMPLDSTMFVYENPRDKSKTLKHVMARLERAPGAAKDAPGKGWAMELPSGTTRYLKTVKGRGIVAATDISKPNAFIIRLDPPEPIVHVAGKTGNQVRENVRIRICDIDSPEDTSYSGTVKCEWEDLGAWKVRVPKGTYDTRLIRIKYDGSIGPASVSAWKYVFLSKGIGAVAFTDSRDISAFIFYNNDVDHAGVLKSATRASGG